MLSDCPNKGIIIISRFSKIATVFLKIMAIQTIFLTEIFADLANFAAENS